MKKTLKGAITLILILAMAFLNYHTASNAKIEHNGNISILYYAAFMAESLFISVLTVYLIISDFFRKSFKEAFKNSDKMIIFVLAVLLLTAGLTIADSCFARQNNKSEIIQETTENSKQKENNNNNNNTNEQAVSDSNIDLSQYNSDITISESGEYNLSGSFENTIIINARGDVNLKLSGVDINSSSGAAIANISKHQLTINITDETENKLSFTGKSKYDACIYSKGNLIITGGGSLDICSNQNGSEGIATDEKDITINGGRIYIESADDGINAGGDGAQITINDGFIFIKASGDGIDSNENIVINGGTIYSMGSPAGGDAGLDSDKGIEVNGGTVIALGFDMLEAPQNSSKQNAICFNLDSTIKRGEIIALVNDKNETIISFEAKEDFRTLIISSADLEIGRYKLYQGGANSGTEDNGIYSGGEYTGGTEISVNNQTEFEVTGAVTKISKNTGIIR